MGEPERAGVIDDGTGVYLWDGRDPVLLGKEWVFMGVFRCESCGRSVTILRFAGDDYSERLFRRQKHCPGGCAAVRGARGQNSNETNASPVSHASSNSSSEPSAVISADE